MRVAFFGLPLAALLLHRDGHEITYAALSRTMPGTRRVKRLLPEVDVKPDAGSARTLARVRAAKPDLVVSWFWTKRLPMELVSVAPRGGFGVHPSLLPRHRGPDPYFWAIDAGDAVTGVTAHRIAAEYDTGAVLGRRELAVDPRWNAWHLARALDRPSLALLREVTRAFARDGGADAPRETAQVEAEATLAPTLLDEELELDWTWTTECLARRIRAAAPWPGAWSFFADEPVTILRAAPAPSFPRALAPGEAAVVDGVAVVRTSDGALALLEGRMDAAEGEEPHALDAGDLAEVVAGLHELAAPEGGADSGE